MTKYILFFVLFYCSSSCADKQEKTTNENARSHEFINDESPIEKRSGFLFYDGKFITFYPVKEDFSKPLCLDDLASSKIDTGFYLLKDYDLLDQIFEKGSQINKGAVEYSSVEISYILPIKLQYRRGNIASRKGMMVNNHKTIINGKVVKLMIVNQYHSYSHLEPTCP